jgi:hypothetical protein
MNILQAHIDELASSDWACPREIRSAARQVFEKGIGLLKPISGGKAWIAGGALRAIIDKEPVNDIDCYFDQMESVDETFRHICSIQSLKTKLLYCDEMVINLETSIGKIDLIRRLHSDPVKCLLDFDFTCCQLAVDINQQVYWGENTLEHINDKKLIISNPQNPLGTLLRLMKYSKKGYSLDVDEAMKIADAIKISDYYDTFNRLKGRALY